jgi:epoxyqueuosine reductase
MSLELAYSAELGKSNSIYRIVEADRINDIKNEVDAMQASHKHLDDYNYYADESYDFSILDAESIKSIFITATPSPFYTLKIESSIDLRIPPIYGNRSAIVNESKRITESVFARFGYRTYPTLLPKKLIAAHCGLASYGNNGITYTKDFGSHYRLTVFASDYECSEKSCWNDISLMKSCQKCGKCVQTCPVRALEKGSAWVDTNKCITRFNEQPGDFPDWIHSNCFTSLVGCVLCQEICPQNSNKAKEVAIPVSMDTINQIMAANTYDELGPKERELLSELSMDRYFHVLRRNIKALMEKGKC